MKKFFLIMLTLIMSVTAWAQDPYFEVVDGSFSSGNVKVKVTFPGVITAEMNPDVEWNSVALRYGSTSLQYVYRRFGNITSEGNTITILFDDYLSKTPEGAEGRKFYLQLAGSDILLDGERPSSYIYPRPKDMQPYAEVTSGSLTSGTMTVKVTVPYVDVITNKDRTYYYATLTYDNTELAKVKGTELTTEGNTISVTFDSFTAPKDNLMRYRVKLDNYMLDFDGASSPEMNVSFKGFTECGHANIISHAAKEPTTEEAGNKAYDFCEDCGKYFLASDSKHENPVKWSVIEIEKICTHEGFWGEDDICSHCGVIREHGNMAKKSWTKGDITVTYNPRNLSLTFSGNGYLPTLDYSTVVDGDYFTASIKCFPWYEELGLYQTKTSYGSNDYKHAPLNTVIIEDGVKAYGYDRATYYLNAAVVIIHQSAPATAAFWFWRSTLIIVDNENNKGLYNDSGASVYTKAEAEAQGITSFPQAALQENCHHSVKYHKVPVCNRARKNMAYEYCPVCGVFFYTDGKYSYPDNTESHNYNSAHKCSDCGMYEPEFCTHEQTTTYEAVAATDEHPGHIAFQKCHGCNQYFAANDASHSRPLNWQREVLIAQTGIDTDCEHESYTNGICDNCGAVCPHEKVSKTRPECFAAEMEFVYECDKCHLHFMDAACLNPIEENKVKHNFGPDGTEPFCLNCNRMNPIACDHPDYMLMPKDGVEPTCLTTGLRNHFECQQCGALFESFENKQPVTLQDLVLPLGEHRYHANGVCLDCGAWTEYAPYCAHNNSFYGKEIIGDDRQHCTDEEGTVYYRCNSCYRYFYYPNSGHSATPVNVTRQEIQIPDGSKLHGGHLTSLYLSEPTCTENGYREHKHCDLCGRNYSYYLDDEECTIAKAISDEDFEENYLWGKATHIFNKRILTDTPDEDGFYTYACDRCSEGRSDYKILPAFNADGSNLILMPSSKTGEYSSTTMRLDDSMENQFCPLDFTYSNAYYTREVGEDEMWGILCLPFQFSPSDVTGNFKFYRVKSVTKSGDVRAYKLGESSGFKNAGEATIFCKTVSGAETMTIKSQNKKTNWNAPTQVKFPNSNGLGYISSLMMQGNIKTTAIKSDDSVKRLYVSGKENMKPAPENKEVVIPHFRGWFECTDNPRETVFFLMDENDSVTRVLTIGKDGNLQECTDIHDLSGRKLARPQKGQINIVNGKKLFVK